MNTLHHTFIHELNWVNTSCQWKYNTV